MTDGNRGEWLIAEPRTPTDITSLATPYHLHHTTRLVDAVQRVLILHRLSERAASSVRWYLVVLHVFLRSAAPPQRRFSSIAPEDLTKRAMVYRGTRSRRTSRSFNQEHAPLRGGTRHHISCGQSAGVVLTCRPYFTSLHCSSLHCTVLHFACLRVLCSY